VGDGAAVVAVSCVLSWRRLTAAARTGMLAVAVVAGGARAQRTATLPHPACAARDLVPPLAPDTVAEHVLDSLGTIAAPSRPGVRYLRNLLAARFDSTAPQGQRQAAVDRVCGVVVGGDHSDGGADGYYLVRLRGAESVSALDAAADAMRHMPGVMSAQTLALRSADAAEAPDAGATGDVASCADGRSGGSLRIAAVREMVSSRDPRESRLMNGIGLGNLDSADVHVVRDGAVCARVAAAIRSAARFTPDGAPFLVLSAGPRYVAFDPTGVNRWYFIVDTSFVFRTVLR
jgi:hypothetical protein